MNMEYKRLGDVATYVNGYAFKPSDWSDVGFPIIRIQDLTGTSYQTNKYNGDYAKKYEINNGDVLISWSASLGVYVWKGTKALLNQHIFKVVFDKEVVDKDFFVHQVACVLKKSTSEAHGATMKHLTKPVFDALPFYLPTIEKQKEIATILNRVTGIIELRKQQLQQLDELVKARFVEMFGDPMTNSHGYTLKKYGELFELNAGGTPSKQKLEYWENGTVSWIGSNMCQNTTIYENDGNYITEEGLKHSSARMFPVDTVLIALVGATIGKTALLKFETTTNQNVLGVRGIRENGYTPEFVFYYTQGLYQKFLNIGDGGFAMASKGFISELPIPSVDLELQNQFAAFVEQTDKSKVAVQKALDEAQTLFDSLMQEYFG